MSNLKKYFNYIDRDQLLSGIWNTSSKHKIASMPYYLATNSELINIISKVEYTTNRSEKQEMKECKYIDLLNSNINTESYGVPIKFGDDITFGGQSNLFGDRAGGQVEIDINVTHGIPEIITSRVPEVINPNHVDGNTTLVRGSEFFVDKFNGKAFINSNIMRDDSFRKYYKITTDYGIERVDAKVWEIFVKKEKFKETKKLAYPNRSEISKLIFDTAGIEFYMDQEVIVDKYRKLESDVIITDKRVYRTPKGSKSKYIIGQKSEKYAPVIEGIDILVPGVDTHIPENVNFIAIPADLLDPRIGGELKFPNSIVPTIVSQDADGITKIEFQIIGNSASVNMFWQMIHERGKESGQTLARKLDRRKIINTEPDVSTLPRFINPAKFVFDNVLSGRAIVIAISENIKWAYDKISNDIQYIRDHLPVGSSIITFTY